MAKKSRTVKEAVLPPPMSSFARHTRHVLPLIVPSLSQEQVEQKPEGVTVHALHTERHCVHKDTSPGSGLSAADGYDGEGGPLLRPPLEVAGQIAVRYLSQVLQITMELPGLAQPAPSLVVLEA
jgi:hypothetical protein